MPGFNYFATRVAKMAQRNLPTILSGFAVGGVISTTVLAVRATPAALDAVANKKFEISAREDVEPLSVALTKREFIEATWRLYLPTALSAVGTISCIVGANTVHLKRQAALAAAYSLTERAWEEYRDQVVETIGEKKEEELRAEVNRKRIEANPPESHELVYMEDDKILCLEARSGRYFYSTKEDVRKAQNDVNAEAINIGYVCQNEFYTRVGLPRTTEGDEVGWTPENKMEIAFSFAGDPKGTPCLCIDYYESPRANFDNVWR